MINEMEALNLKINSDWALDTEVLTFDKDTLIDSIIMKGGTFEPIYTDPYFLKQMSSAWWKKWKPTFERWWEAAEDEYEPLWDRNGWEEIHDDITDTGYNNNDYSSKEIVDDDTTHSSTSTDSITSNTTNKVSAYDAGNTLVTHDSSDTTTSNTTTASGAGTDDRTTNVSGSSDTDMGNDRDYDHSLHTWGNWGISTTAQKLLEQEIKVRGKFNLYELMSDVFLRELCVRVF